MLLIIGRITSVQTERYELGLTEIEKQADRKYVWRFPIPDTDDIAPVLANVADDRLVCFFLGLRPFEFVRHSLFANYLNVIASKRNADERSDIRGP
jgi:hypothetical protein